MATNQQKLFAGLELHEGTLGEREFPHVVAYYPAVYTLAGNKTYRIPTTRFRKYPKMFRQSKRRLRRQRRREYLQSQGLKKKTSRSYGS